MKPANARTRWIGGLEAAARRLQESPDDGRELWIEHQLQRPELGLLIRRAKELGLTVRFVSRPELDRAVQGRHQGVALRAVWNPAASFAEWLDGLDERVKAGLVVVALDQIQDPHNLGAIARSALQLGASCLVIPDRRSASVTPAVVAASAGAALKIPIHRVVNLAQTLARCRERGLWIYGADAAGKDAWAAPIQAPCALVVGSEGYGLRPLVRASCDELLRVPQSERGVGSLNASCAAAVLLYEIARRRARPGA
ncbi:MAG: 23S rRNA (guanosine(2251)-2'-O)-methyltransferase RlmB [Elusimicrobia bacterium]|nr:23S rRNA (guanosine(2251)-2'-O)-methyltransferase RlmB [Elusimicrobiota bacterium]